MIKGYEFLRILIFPLLRFLIPLMSHKAKKRVEFELSNLMEISKLNKAEYGFEVSSEGELEQVMYLINYLLEHEKTVEIIYCSESVEHKIKALSKSYPLQLRTLRMPLLTYKPWIRRQNAFSWLTCHTFILCRYDFFPELIFYGNLKAQNFYLVSGSSKNFSNKNFISKKYLSFCYKSFNKIITATTQDLERYISLDLVKRELVLSADLRVMQINQRLEKKNQTIKEKLPIFYEFQKEVLDKNSLNCIFGSFWSHESSIFSMVSPDRLFSTSYCLVPHKLDKQELLAIIQKLSRFQLGVYIITSETTKDDLLQLIAEYREHPGVWIFDIKGILCELYSHFDYAYVGGGFGESIHSVLEPYLSGCTTFCGPKTDRSSEFDYVSAIDSDKIISCVKREDVLKTIRSSSKLQSHSRNINLPFEISDILNFLNLKFEGNESVK